MRERKNSLGWVLANCPSPLAWIFELLAGVVIFNLLFDWVEYYNQTKTATPLVQIRNICLFLIFNFTFISIFENLRFKYIIRPLKEKERAKTEREDQERNQSELKNLVSRTIVKAVIQNRIAPKEFEEFQNFHDGLDYAKQEIINECVAMHSDCGCLPHGRFWMIGSYEQYIEILKKFCESLVASNMARWICLYPPYYFYSKEAVREPLHLAAFNDSSMILKERILIFRNTEDIRKTLKDRFSFNKWMQENNNVFCVYIFSKYLRELYRDCCMDDFATFDDDVLLKFSQFKDDPKGRGLCEICLKKETVARYLQVFFHMRSLQPKGGGQFFF